MFIRRGDRGEAVKQVQQALQQFGFDLDDDGVFGRQTETIVRNFQRQHGLDDDGIVGPLTLAALGLPEDLSDQQTNIDFTVDEVEVPAAIQRQIEQYVARLQDQHERLLDKARDALDQFETTMTFASTRKASPSLLDTLLSKAITFARDQFIAKAGKFIPGLTIATELFELLAADLQAAKSSSSAITVGDWIKDQRVVLDRVGARFNRERMQENLSLSFLEAQDRLAFADELFQADQRLQNELLPTVSTLELQLYEGWINAHFRTIGDDEPGCIEYRYEFDDNTFDFVSCTVQAEAGDKVGNALNRLFDQNLVTAAERPIDLNVKKRACFRTDNFVPGGKSWFCGWLDEKNTIIHLPLKEEAQQAIHEPIWRHHKRFDD